MKDNGSWCMNVARGWEEELRVLEFAEDTEEGNLENLKKKKIPKFCTSEAMQRKLVPDNRG